MIDAIYYNTIDQIYHAQWAVSKLARLELLRKSIKRLWPKGHPTRLVQVAGTSGKGSTCRFLELGFSCVGKAGALMSPHLFDYRERFSINGEPVSRDDITDAWEGVIKPLCLDLALQNERYVHTFSEISILIALVLFEKHQVEWAAIETGVGGRYDQTTALEVAATLLTNVGRDHEHLLGQEQWQRALDKAGIARKGIPFFTSERDPLTREIISSVCESLNAPVYFIEQSHVEELNDLLDNVTEGDLLPDSLLHVEKQKWNAALSLEVISHLFPGIDRQQVVKKFLKARLPGRFSQIKEKIYADVAHNPEKIAVLAREVEQRFERNGKIFIVGISGMRSPSVLLTPLMQIKGTKALIITKASFKGQDPCIIKEEIEAITQNQGILTLIVPNPQEALIAAESIKRDEDIIILTGSTYMIDQALNPDKYMRFINATYGWRTYKEIKVEGNLHFTLPWYFELR